MAVHLMAFIFYTLAMLGIIFVAFIVYKNVVLNQSGSHNSKLKIEDMLRLSQRKSIYVIKYEDEKFLIAGDLDSTTFLAKLDSKVQKITPELIKEESREEIEPQNKLYNIKNQIKANNSASNNVMRNILKELNSHKERF